MKIQQLALGFLDLLNAKTQGRNPEEFANELRPTLEMGKFYQLASRDWLGLSGTCSSPGSGTLAFAVPENEFWLLHAISGTITANGASANTILDLRVSGPSSDSGEIQVTIHTSRDTALDSAAGQTSMMSGLVLPDPLIMKPGESARFTCRRYSSVTPGTTQLRLCVTRFGPASKVLAV